MLILAINTEQSELEESKYVDLKRLNVDTHILTCLHMHTIRGYSAHSFGLLMMFFFCFFLRNRYFIILLRRCNIPHQNVYFRLL